MARGWESKSIEAQQEEALSPREQKPALSPEERVRLDRRQAIELALTAKRRELANATSAAHQAYLKRAISALEADLSQS
jgi:predicted ATPase